MTDSPTGSNFRDATQIDVELSELAGWLAVRQGLINSEEFLTATEAASKIQGSSVLDVLVENGSISQEDYDSVQDLSRSHVTTIDRLKEKNPPKGHEPDLTDDLTADGVAIDGAEYPGDLFGDYELIAEIARGGMGVVYQARQRKLNRMVALKTIISGVIADDVSIRRFHAEAEAAGKLNHPGIVPVYEVGERNGIHFYSMEFVKGKSLHEKIVDGGPLNHTTAAKYILTVAESIQFAHDAGIIHRDIKPRNILLDHQDYPKVTDFGISKQLRNDSELTATGQIMGSPSYMSPEQAKADFENIGKAADIYALGATFYFLLTGRPPFHAATAFETTQQVIDAEPVPPRRLNPNIPRDLETICLRCMRKVPQDRFASAAELASDLERWLQKKPIKSRPVGAMENAWIWCKRNPAVAGTLSLFFLSLIVGSVVSTIFAIKASSNAKESQQRFRDLQRTTFNLALAGSSEQITINPEIVSEQLTDPERCPPELRDFSWRFYKNLSDRNLRWIVKDSIKKHADRYSVSHVNFSNDGKKLVYITSKGLIRGIDVESNETLFQHSIQELNLEVPLSGSSLISDDGKWIIIQGMMREKTRPVIKRCALKFNTSNGQVEFIDSALGNPIGFFQGGKRLMLATRGKAIEWNLEARRPIRPIPVTGSPKCVSEDGKRIACIDSKARKLIVYDFRSRKSTPKTIPLAQRNVRCILSPDGKYLAIQQKAFQIWDVENQRLIKTLELNFPSAMAFSTGSSSFIAGSYYGTAKVWSIPDFNERATMTELKGSVASVALNSKVQVAAASSNSLSHQPGLVIWNQKERWSHVEFKMLHDAEAYNLEFIPGTRKFVINSGRMFDIDQTQSVSKIGATGPMGILSFSGDDYFVYTKDRKLHVWSLQQKKDVKKFVDFEAVSARFSNDGTLLASLGKDQVIRIWKVKNWELIKKLESNEGRGEIGFSENDRWLFHATGNKFTTWSKDGFSEHQSITTNGFGRLSPDGKTLVVVDGKSKRLQLYDFETGESTGSLEPGKTSSVQFSIDGKTLVTGGSGGKLTFWDPVSGDRRGSFQAHNDHILAIAFSDDGKFMITSSMDETIKVWSGE